MHLLKRDPDDPGKLLLGHADLQPMSPDTGCDPPMEQLGEIARRFHHYDRPQRKGRRKCRCWARSSDRPATPWVPGRMIASRTSPKHVDDAQSQGRADNNHQ
jgi:hypothetical protein